MARRRRAEKRELTPDVRYNDVIVTQFINYMMMRGKRTLSEKLFYSAAIAASSMTTQRSPSTTGPSTRTMLSTQRRRR